MNATFKQIIPTDTNGILGTKKTRGFLNLIPKAPLIE